MNTIRVVFALLVSAVCLCGGPGAAAAAPFPHKPVVYLIPFNPGGDADILAREQLPFVERELGQRLLITYKTGGGGAVGWAELIRARPDGYGTACFSLPHVVLQPLMRKDPGYASGDIRPVMIFASTPSVLAVPRNSPHQTLARFLDAARASPGALTLGGSGSNSANHITVMRLNKMAGTSITYVPYHGPGQSIPAFLEGRLSGIVTYTSMGVRRAKDMRLLAVASEARHPALPDVPTFREQGFDIVEGAHRGLCVPPGTPGEAVDVLYRAFSGANGDPLFQKAVMSRGFTLENMGPEESARFIEKKRTAYEALLRELGLL